MKKQIIILLFLLLILSSGCVSEGGKWQHATVISKTGSLGNPLDAAECQTVFNDTSGNIYISIEYQGGTFNQASIYNTVEINKTYLVHVNGNGYVDRVSFEGD